MSRGSAAASVVAVVLGLLPACGSDYEQPPAEWLAVTLITRRACRDAELAYGDFRAHSATTAETVQRFSKAYDAADAASDLIYDGDVLIPIRDRSDFQPAAIAGAIGDMWSALADDHDLIRLGEHHETLEDYCGSARLAGWKE